MTPEERHTGPDHSHQCHCAASRRRDVKGRRHSFSQSIAVECSEISQGMVSLMQIQRALFLNFSGSIVLALMLLIGCFETPRGAAGSPIVSLPAAQTITPGPVWRDTQGHVIQAHGGGFIQVGKTYYWFGEDHTDGAAYRDIPCYASTDLAHWTFRDDALARQPVGDLGPNRVVERPKVLYNRRTKKYVMYLHIDNQSYSEAKVGVAVSRNVTGPYTYLGSFSPMGHQSRDMTLFQDVDGTAYVVFEDRGDGGGLRIEQLAPDYLTIARDVAVVGARGGHEAPAIVHILSH
jgi:hypothetical protein